MDRKLKIAVVGLHFGGEFPAIYRDHPDAVTAVFWKAVGICAHDSAMCA